MPPKGYLFSPQLGWCIGVTGVYPPFKLTVCPWKIDQAPKRTFIFQPSIFRGYGSFSGLHRNRASIPADLLRSPATSLPNVESFAKKGLGVRFVEQGFTMWDVQGTLWFLSISDIHMFNYCLCIYCWCISSNLWFLYGLRENKVSFQSQKRLKQTVGWCDNFNPSWKQTTFGPEGGCHLCNFHQISTVPIAGDQLPSSTLMSRLMCTSPYLDGWLQAFNMKMLRLAKISNQLFHLDSFIQ